MVQNQVTIIKKIAIVGLGTNFHKNYQGILHLFRECKLIFVDGNYKYRINIPCLTHEQFINLKDFSEYQIILTSYKLEEFVKIYSHKIEDLFLFKYSQNYDSIIGVLKYSNFLNSLKEKPEFKKNRNVFITGASSGIGESLSKKLLRNNYVVYGLSKSDATFLHPNYHHLKFTLNSNSNFDELLKLIPGNLNSVYLNAGISQINKTEFTTSHAEINNIYQTNTFGNILLLQALIRTEKINESSSLVYTKTNATRSINEAIYISSKYAFERYINEFSMSEFDTFKNIFIIDPGWINTKMGGIQANNNVESIYPSFLMPLCDNINTRFININALDYSMNSLNTCFNKMRFLDLI
jgi:NAD(P)-dependent dehydrogenase (short-subunit alcohol dehydrogenase family)